MAETSSLPKASKRSLTASHTTALSLDSRLSLSLSLSLLHALIHIHIVRILFISSYMNEPNEFNIIQPTLLTFQSHISFLILVGCIFSLSDNPVCTHGSTFIAEALSHNTTLQELELNLSLSPPLSLSFSLFSSLSFSSQSFSISLFYSFHLSFYLTEFLTFHSLYLSRTHLFLWFDVAC